MRMMGTVSTFIFHRRGPGVKEKVNQTLFPFFTFFLCISSGFGEDKPLDCKPESFGICSAPCDYVRNVCDRDLDCFLNLCAYLYRPEHDHLRLMFKCRDLILECAELFPAYETKSASKRGILNKNFAYLLLKLHPFFNQTSQFGFLTSGRIRRITGNFGTEFLGKRSDKGRNGNGNEPKIRPTVKPRFYSLPLNKFSQAKVIKRDHEYQEDVNEKRTPGRGGNGGVIFGSEFLGKRGGSQKFEIVPSSSADMYLRETGSVEGSEFLGKRYDQVIHGSELLGKKSGRYPLNGFLGKKLVRNRLRKQTGNELLGKKSLEPKDLYGNIWSETAPDVENDDFGSQLNVRILNICKESNFTFEFCQELKTESKAN